MMHPGSALGAKGSYYHLFAGYALATLATGVAVVALAILAYELTGDDAGAVIGTALSIKMLAYVIGAPLLTAWLCRLPRGPLMVTLDLVRAGSLLLLPFVTTAWQIYALVFLFTLASAGFTPAYQASVAQLLPNREAYSASLARSRVVSELDGALSPLIAAGLLLVLSFKGVFIVAMLVLLASALLIARAGLQSTVVTPDEGGTSQVLKGFRVLLGRRELRMLFPLGLALAAGSAMVMTNTVLFVQGVFDMDSRATAVALAVFGAGSVVGALLVPALLRRFSERRLMFFGGAVMVVSLSVGIVAQRYPTLLVMWFAIGLGAALAQLPAANLIRRIVSPDDYQMVYAASFALATAAMGVGYAVAGWLGVTIGLTLTFAVLAGVTACAIAIAASMSVGGHGADDVAGSARG